MWMSATALAPVTLTKAVPPCGEKVALACGLPTSMHVSLLARVAVETSTKVWSESSLALRIQRPHPKAPRD
jgi:hypothetical protein